MLKIKVMSVTKKDMLKDFERREPGEDTFENEYLNEKERVFAM